MHAIIERIRKKTEHQRLKPPVSKKDLLEAEHRFGFALPTLLRELYSEIGDGGFGPSYGLLPLITPVPDEKLVNGSLPGTESVLELYELFRKGDPENPSWSWPDRLIPVLDWGCAIRSCVDCSTQSSQIIRDEPYVRRVLESSSLELWLSDWLDGKNLWKTSG